MASKSSPHLKVMHVISGDLWAGAEVQAFTLLSQIRHSCDLFVVLMNPGHLADKLEQQGVRTSILDESKLGSGALLIRLIKLMRAFKPDIVHTHRTKENILGGLANATSVRAKCLRTIHGSPEFSPRGLRYLRVILDRLVGKYAQHAIIAVSGELGEKLSESYPASKIHVIRNGIDVDALKAASGTADFRLNMPHHIHIGIIGRLEPVKRLDIFLGMIPCLSERLPQVKLYFHVIGDGGLRAKLEGHVKANGMEALIKFHGNRKDIPACISSLNAVVMCSDHEGTPMTALETLALGTPLIAHKTGGLGELLISVPECLVTDHSASGYADSLARIISESPPKIPFPSKYRAETNAEHTFLLYKRIC